MDDLNKVDGVLGYLEINSTGEVIRTSGDEADALGSVIGYFQQMAGVIGDSLGFDPLDEAYIFGKTTTSICLPRDESTYGIICSSRAKLPDVLAKLD